MRMFQNVCRSLGTILTIEMGFESRCSSVDIATGYRLDVRGSGFGGSILGGNWEFSLHHRAQTGYGNQPASYPEGTGGSIPGGKAARA
jgi:hypothetical protein